MYHIEECSNGARMPEIFGMDHIPKRCIPDLLAES
jgi:hypothetical protein